MVSYIKGRKINFKKPIKNTKGILPKRWKDLIRMIKKYRMQEGLSLKRWKDLKNIKTSSGLSSKRLKDLKTT